ADSTATPRKSAAAPSRPSADTRNGSRGRCSTASISVEVPRVDYEKLASDTMGVRSMIVRDRVEAARGRQTARFVGSRLAANAEMTPTEVREHCQARLDEQAQSLLRLAMSQLSLSARAFHRILKLARTIADMSGSEPIAASHLAEAIQYRQRVRG